MSLEFLERLSNADAIAANEQEVRNVMIDELESYADSIEYDGLGSIIFKKVGNVEGPKIMICAHMDEVGFIVRNITDHGQIILMPVGGVKPLAQMMQKVRITTDTGKKIDGIIQAKYLNDAADEAYVDIGAQTREDVLSLGIEIGNMVTFSSEFERINLDNLIIGKAFDDRLGCYVMGELLKRLNDMKHPNTVYFVATSSEEVGIRGAKTASYKIDPHVVFPIDVACFNDEFITDYRNKRQIGHGMIQTNFDRTLSPNKKLISFIRESALNAKKNLQLDMFNKGGTDGGEAHKCREGKPTAVSCIPVRYGHCAYSIANYRDIQDTIDIFINIIKNFDQEKYKEVISFGRMK